jgi:glycosyltransferase involved in cell wall biosynthesis
VAEVVEHGVTGFIVRNQQEAIAAARRLHEIDRGRCRARFEQRFTAATMAQRYLELYARLARSKMLAAVA